MDHAKNSPQIISKGQTGRRVSREIDNFMLLLTDTGQNILVMKIFETNKGGQF